MRLEQISYMTLLRQNKKSLIKESEIDVTSKKKTGCSKLY